jgi:hypothetical protein
MAADTIYANVIEKTSSVGRQKSLLRHAHRAAPMSEKMLSATGDDRSVTTRMIAANVGS